MRSCSSACDRACCSYSKAAAKTSARAEGGECRPARVEVGAYLSYTHRGPGRRSVARKTWSADEFGSGLDVLVAQPDEALHVSAEHGELGDGSERFQRGG